MKKIIVNFLIVVTFLTGLSAYAFAGSIKTTVNNKALTENLTATDVLSDVFRVRGYKTRWHKIYVEADTNVDIELTGDGSTNLDLYVYDSSNRLITAEDGSEDYELAELEVYQSGYLWVGVTNRGNVANEYELTVEDF